jgi:hypothetical protein
MADEPPASVPAAAAETDALLERAQALISRVVEQEADPNPRLIHTLATLCEHHETRSVRLHPLHSVVDAAPHLPLLLLCIPTISLR